MSIRFGVSPIAWANDDMPELGGDTPLADILRDIHELGFEGVELGGKFPRDAASLREVLARYHLDLIGGWYSGSLLHQSASEEIAALQPHLALLKALGSTVFVFAETSNAVHGNRGVALDGTPRLRADEWPRFGARLTEVADYIQAQGLRFAYHHHLGTVVERGEDVDAFLRYTGAADVAARKPGVLTKVGLETLVDPVREASAMNAKGAAQPIVFRVEFGGETWLHFPNITPDVCVLRATTADEHGNLTYEHEGAYLGGLDQAIATRNHGGLVIAQVKRMTARGSLRPHDVRVPGHLVDLIVLDTDQKQTTETPHDPAISGEVMRPWASFRLAEHGVEKVIARRAAMELRAGQTANLGFGISAMVPRVLLEEGQAQAVTWAIEQGAVGG